MKTKSNWFWLILIGLVLALCAAWIGFRYYQRAQQAANATVGPIAVVRQNGVLVDAIDLGKVEESYTYTYETGDGDHNTVEIANGRIRVIEATCPDHLCIEQGWLDMEYYLGFIACLPNSLVIEIDTPEDLGLDTVTR